MRGTFNAFGQIFKAFDPGNVPVWLGVVSPVPVGGVLASDFVVARAYLKAGSPINLTGKVIKPVLTFKVVSTGDGTFNVKPVMHNYLLSTDDTLVKVSGDTYPSGAGTAITGVTDNGDGTLTVTSALTVAENDILAIAGVVPNAYLYNDIYLGDIDPTLEGAGATGAAVKFHSEGILIDRTPACEIASYMAALVPGVLQVNG